MKNQQQAPSIVAGRQGDLFGTFDNEQVTNKKEETQPKCGTGLMPSLAIPKNEVISDISIEKVSTTPQKQVLTHTLLKAKEPKDILSELLDQVQELNFRSIAGLDEDQKVSKKVYCVLAISELLRLAEAESWGLATKDSFLYVYDGRMWKLTDVSAMKRFLGNAALKMGIPPLDAKHYQFKDELYRQFIDASNLPTPPKSESTMVNLLNGVLVIDEQGYRLINHDRKYFFKYILPFELDATAKSPLFDKYIKDVLPEEELQKILFEFIGYIFIPSAKMKLEKALILYGSGANGKSVLFEIMCSMLGRENICAYSLQNLTKHDSYQRAELANKLLNYASEINGKLDADVFKQLASGEAVEARRIYGSPFIMEDYAKLMFNCNELPKEVEQTNAFFRRFILLPFNKTIPIERQDTELANKIIENELSGIFNYVLKGLTRLLSQKKFTDSKVVRSLVDQFRKESDSVAMFIDEECYETSDTYISLKEIFGGYKGYCLDFGCKACGMNTFSKRLRSLGYNITRMSMGNVVYLKK